MNGIHRVATVVLLTLSSAVIAAAVSATPASNEKPKPAKPVVAVGATLDASGRLWLVKVDNQRLLVSQSDDGGQRFSTPVEVSQAQEIILADGENRPFDERAFQFHPFPGRTMFVELKANL